MTQQWQTVWEAQRAATGVGCHIYSYKTIIAYWPWASIPSNRTLETSLARMRIGHCGLRAHLYRFGLHWSPLCDCGAPETVEHYLMRCPLFVAQRAVWARAAANMDVDFTLSCVLGGGNFSSGTQKLLTLYVNRYLRDTRKAGTI
jgi:hypothetical protein